MSLVLAKLLERGMVRIRPLLDLANGRTCQNCGADDHTIVAAHSNEQEHGRGKDLQSHDCFHAWLCVRCHSWYDQASVGLDPTKTYQPTKEEKSKMFNRAKDRTTLELWRRKLVRVA